MAKQKGDQLPSIEKMFEVAVRSVVELGEMLGLSIDQVVELIKVAWQTEVNYKEGEEEGTYEMIETSVGRLLFQEIVPPELGRMNETLKKGTPAETRRSYRAHQSIAVSGKHGDRESIFLDTGVRVCLLFGK
jgi:hypothetical protein